MATVNTPSTTNSTENRVLTYLKHLGLLALWSALSVVVVTLIASVSKFDVSGLQPQYQVLAGVLLPVIVSALSNTKTEIDSQLQVEEAQKQVALAQQETAVAKAALNQ